MKQVFGMTDDDFQARTNTGEMPVTVEQPSRFSEEILAGLAAIVGEENVKTDDWSRASVCYGKTMVDVTRLRAGIIENPPDAVVDPRSADDVRRLVDYCSEHRIPITAFGAGSAVTRGSECVPGGISLRLGTHMKRILSVDPINQTATVEPGSMGRRWRGVEQRAGTLWRTARYTCGHFPQSFEYSTVGGWVVTLAGTVLDLLWQDAGLVVWPEYVTPAGNIGQSISRRGHGARLEEIMMGCEGAYGILVEVTLKIRRFAPENRRRFGFVFRDWESGVEACREICRGKMGFRRVPAFGSGRDRRRIEALRVGGHPVDRVMTLLGYKPVERCLYSAVPMATKSGGSDEERDPASAGATGRSICPDT